MQRHTLQIIAVMNYEAEQHKETQAKIAEQEREAKRNQQRMSNYR